MEASDYKDEVLRKMLNVQPKVDPDAGLNIENVERARDSSKSAKKKIGLLTDITSTHDVWNSDQYSGVML